MRRLRSWDGTILAYRTVGTGPPLICVPGGPGQAAEYLGDLGGLDRHRTLILLDNRGTGASDPPDDPATYRVDRLPEDLEALRRHLDLDRIDLLGHSASGGTCLLYAADHPHRLHHLILVAPSLRVVPGIPSDLDAATVLAARAHEPWHQEASAALLATPTSPADLQRLRRLAAPLQYARWTPTTKAHAAAEPAQFSAPATDGFYAGYTPDPTLPARLTALTAPILLIAGALDLWPTAAALRAFTTLLTTARPAAATLTVLPAAAHFPWLDTPTPFTTTINQFLTSDH